MANEPKSLVTSVSSSRTPQPRNAERQRLAAEQIPTEQAMREASARVVETEQQLESARQRLMQIDRERGSATVILERLRGEMATLCQRIVDDLELDEPTELLAQPVDELDIDMIEAEREIGRLKERLRRVGYIGDEAVQEFERESERHLFLSTQLEDVRTASASLRELLDDLRGTMKVRFEETFTRVAKEFSAAFTTLFGGGTAKLVLIDNDDGGPSGVDIVAQPPGKRLQSLALLSGGERALTAAALLFAILKVNPSPFVLLDEVDAALDEANVVRFRERLQDARRRYPGDHHHPQPRNDRSCRFALRRQHARGRRFHRPIHAHGERDGGPQRRLSERTGRQHPVDKKTPASIEAGAWTWIRQLPAC